MINWTHWLILCMLLWQILVYGLFYGKLAIYRLKKNPDILHQPLSVIVCAHNEYQNLKKLIPRILDQDHSDFEVIVANDRSSDKTLEYLNGMVRQHSMIKMINISSTPEGINPKKYALSLAIAMAKNDILVLTDADCIPASQFWLSIIQTHFRDKVEIVLGFSPYLRVGATLLDQMISYETLQTAMQYLSFALWGKPYMGVGRNLAYRKSLFDKMNGFDKNIASINGGDDDLLISKLANYRNTVICLEKGAFCISYPKTNWKDWYLQKIRHLSVSKFYSPSTKILLGTIHISQMIYWLYFCLFMLDFIRSHEVFILLCIRMLLLIFIQKIILRKFSLNLSFWVLPILDLVYTLCIPIVALLAWNTKKILWK
jgi:cellulose synthase/poly-beta-1,6-N-acetylglucosamine synthase-like glycosyltransferase